VEVSLSHMLGPMLITASSCMSRCINYKNY